MNAPDRPTAAIIERLDARLLRLDVSLLLLIRLEDGRLLIVRWGRGRSSVLLLRMNVGRSRSRGELPGLFDVGGLIGRRGKGELAVHRCSSRRRICHTADGFAEEVRVDALATDLMLLAMRVQVILSLESTSTKVALEFVFGAVGATMTGESGGIVEGFPAEWSFTDKWSFVVVSTHVALIAVAR